MEGIERMRHHRTPPFSQGSNDDYEGGIRHRDRTNKDGMEDVKVKILKFQGAYDPEVSLD